MVLVMKGYHDGGIGWVNLPACRTDRHGLTKDLGAKKLVVIRE